jgi:hypothetical protein
MDKTDLEAIVRRLLDALKVSEFHFRDAVEELIEEIGGDDDDE